MVKRQPAKTAVHELQALAAVPLMGRGDRCAAGVDHICIAGMRQTMPGERRRLDNAFRPEIQLASRSITAPRVADCFDLRIFTEFSARRGRRSGVFEVENEFLNLAEGGTDVIFRSAAYSRFEVREHRTQFFGVVGIGVGFQALRLGNEGL